MKKFDTVNSRVKTLLQNLEYLRDDKWDCIAQYRFYYPSDTVSEESISREWRRIQQYNIDLRGKQWQERQSHAVHIGRKIRSQEGPEDLSHMFSEANPFRTPNYLSNKIQSEKETVFEYIKRVWLKM